MSRRHMILLCFLAFTTAFSLVYAFRQAGNANDLENSTEQLRMKLASAQAKIRALDAEARSRTEAAATEVTSPPPFAPQIEAKSTPQRVTSPAPLRRRPTAQKSSAAPKVVEDPRWKRVESKLAEHQSQLATHRERIDETQQMVRKTGDQLDGKIDSTRAELNHSIANNHDEVVLLQKRGEHDTYEFDLSKSKQFQRVGPLSLSLRKADAKRRYYDLSVMVDDVNVEKKHVNLLEPVWIHLSDRQQPIQVVVNRIDKDKVSGYISAPRYKITELGGQSAPALPQTPTLKTR
jgi:hypothetical protein